jgi:hypothetical protein
LIVFSASYMLHFWIFSNSMMFHLVIRCQCLPGSQNSRTREVGTQCHKVIYIVSITLKILAFSFLPVYSGIKYRSKEVLAINNSERIGMSAIMVVALILLLVSLASAQGILDGKWFSVKVKTTTLWWQSTTIPIQKRTDSFSAYMQFVWKSQNLGIQQYDCAIWTQDITGT